MAFAPGRDAKEMAKGVVGHELAALSKPGQLIALNHQHLILRRVKIHDFLRRKLEKISAQAPACSAVGNGDSISSNPSKPIHHTLIKLTEAFAFGWCHI